MKSISITDRAKDLVRGSWDLHIHPYPSVYPRKQDDFEISLDLSSSHMAGGVIKTHYESTVGRAEIANKYSGGSTTLYGSIVLNRNAGGLNPFAVSAALSMGAKIIWFPTRDALNHMKYDASEGIPISNGLTVLNPDGRIKDPVDEIVDLIRSHNAVMATGHLSLNESVKLCDLARKNGVRSILTHPDWTRTKVPVDIQSEIAQTGVMIEKTWQLVSTGIISEKFFCDSIRIVGPENIILTTDSAYPEEPGPSLGCMQMIQTLLNHGFSDEEIILMNRFNPEKLLF